MNKKGKITLISLCALAGILLCVGLITGFIINRNLAEAPVVEILDDGGNVFVMTKANESYRGYRFKFTGGGQAFNIDSETNILNLSNEERVKVGENYNISVCYLGEMEGNNSQYSKEITWHSYSYLSTPLIILEDNLISWQEVKGADYYEVYTGNKVTIADTNKISFQNLATGNHDIFVVAYSNNQNLRHSQPSNILRETRITHVLSKVSELELNNHVLSFNSIDVLNYVNVFINGIKREVKVEGIKDGEKYRYRADISAIYESGATIGVAPTADDFNFYNDEIVYLN